MHCPVEEKSTPTPASRRALFLEWLLLVFLFALMARRGVFIPFRSDSNGYEAAAWMLSQGYRPYVDFLHSQGPAFLLWGAVWQKLLGDTAWVFRLSACVAYVGAMALALGITARVIRQSLARTLIVAALFLSPVAVWESWNFIGASEMLFGLMVAAWAVMGKEKPNPWLAGFGLGLAMACRLLAAPPVAAMLLTLFLIHRRTFVLTVLSMMGTWLVLVGWTWALGGFQYWWLQTLIYHARKEVIFTDRYSSYLRNGVLLLPALWGVYWLRGPQKIDFKNPMLICGWAAVFLGLGAAFTQKVFTMYYLIPALWGCWVLLVFTIQPTRGSRFWLGFAPILVVSAYPVLTALRPYPPEGNAPGIRAACKMIAARVAPGSSVFAESMIGWPIYQCTQTKPWYGFTDTNLMIFQSVRSFETLLTLLTEDPPAAVVLSKNYGQGGFQPLLKVLRRHYTPIPQPTGSQILVWLPK